MPPITALLPPTAARHPQAKGLQRLKFFCGMCQKQCRDANGFKCHMESETHIRQMELFMAQPDK